MPTFKMISYYYYHTDANQEMIKNAKTSKTAHVLKSTFQNGFYHSGNTLGFANLFLPTTALKLWFESLVSNV